MQADIAFQKDLEFETDQTPADKNQDYFLNIVEKLEPFYYDTLVERNQAQELVESTCKIVVKRNCPAENKAFAAVFFPLVIALKELYGDKVLYPEIKRTLDFIDHQAPEYQPMTPYHFRAAFLPEGFVYPHIEIEKLPLPESECKIIPIDGTKRLIALSNDLAIVRNLGKKYLPEEKALEVIGQSIEMLKDDNVSRKSLRDKSTSMKQMIYEIMENYGCYEDVAKMYGKAASDMIHKGRKAEALPLQDEANLILRSSMTCKAV
jgi:hypothetical protein